MSLLLVSNVDVVGLSAKRFGVRRIIGRGWYAGGLYGRVQRPPCLSLHAEADSQSDQPSERGGHRSADGASVKGPSKHSLVWLVRGSFALC